MRTLGIDLAAQPANTSACAIEWMTIQQREAAGADHNCFDALVCSLVARAAALGLIQLPERGEEADRAAREGWIHLPTNPLPHLLEK